MKRYRPYAPKQPFLLPPSPSEWLPEGHLAFFVLSFVEELDLTEIERVMQGKDARGERSYAPMMMVGLLLYGYATGVYSSRRLARATVEDVACRVLAGGEHPHFTTINEFRATHRTALAGLFVQVLAACQSAGLVKLDHVAIDGTKMKANASKHKAMSYDRLVKDKARLQSEVETWLALADAADAEENAASGEPDPKEEVRLRQERLQKMEAALEALKKETAQARAAKLRGQAVALQDKAQDPSRSPKKRAEAATLAKRRIQQALALDDDKNDPDPPPVSPDDDLPRNTPPSTRDGTPKPKAQRNFTDPESRIMVRDGAFLQAYNAQIAVDEGHQIIVAAALSNQAPDVEYFEPMLRRVVDHCDAVPRRVTADTGYFSAANVRFAERMGTEPFLSVGSHHNDGRQCDAPAAQPQRQTPDRVAMRRRLDEPYGRAAYARRKATVEPVFGQIRAARGFRQMSFRGLWKNRCEWALVCLTHNLLKLFRSAPSAQVVV